VAVKGTIAFVPQQAWILNGSIRSNILFGREFDKQRLADVYKVTLVSHYHSLFRIFLSSLLVA